MVGGLSRLQVVSLVVLAVALALGTTSVFLGWWSLSSNLGGEWETEIKPFERGIGLDDETLTTGLLLVSADVLLLAAIAMELAPVMGRSVHIAFPAAAIILAMALGACAIVYTMEEWPGNGARIDNDEVGFNDRVSQSTMFGTFWLEARPGLGWFAAFAAFGVPAAALVAQSARFWIAKHTKPSIKMLTAAEPLIAIKRRKRPESDAGLRSH